jgi:calcineurin-like phosphoesterase family protein
MGTNMNTYIISDLHFGHANALKFTRDDGSLLRPFASVEEMDETIIANWNSVVRPKDKVMVLGDIVMNKKYLPVLDRLAGQKSLILGNHDEGPVEIYHQWFSSVKAYQTFDGCILSHVPVHPNQFGRFKYNIHGHLHSNYVKLPNGQRDYRYFNVSVDCTDMNWFPKPWDEIKKILADKNEQESI